MQVLFDEAKITRTLRRITHEILERHQGAKDLALLGIEKSGVLLAQMIHDNILAFENVDVPLYSVNITRYRDDVIADGPVFDIDLTHKSVILIDDVLYTGRTVRAAMDAIMDAGRPDQIELAVLIDRGHRELPIRADYVGKNIPTQRKETVIVDMLNTKTVTINKQ